MKSFLDQLAQEILKGEGTDFSDLCVVLPNRRAGVFLRDALSRTGDRAIWAPKIHLTLNPGLLGPTSDPIRIFEKKKIELPKRVRPK